MKMTYVTAIPQKYVEKLAKFEEYFEQSIRNEIIEAVEKYIESLEQELMKR